MDDHAFLWLPKSIDQFIAMLCGEEDVVCPPRLPTKQVGRKGKKLIRNGIAATTRPFLTLEALRPTVRHFVDQYSAVCQPDRVKVCDGSEEENQELIRELVKQGRLQKLTKLENWYGRASEGRSMHTVRVHAEFVNGPLIFTSFNKSLANPFLCSYLARTDPGDVARVEKQTYVCTEKKEDAVPTTKPGVESKLGNWKSPVEMEEELGKKFPGCMKGTLRIRMRYAQEFISCHIWYMARGVFGVCVT